MEGLNKNVKVRAQHGGGLQYLRQTVESTLQYAIDAYNCDYIPSYFLPTAGREVSFTPLFVAAAYKNKISAATEIQITRKSTGSKGRLDLALFSKPNGKRADLIEIKASRHCITRNEKKGIDRISKRLDSARKQLLDIDYRDVELTSPGTISVVIQNIIAPQESKKDGLISCDSFKEEVESYYKRIINEFPGSLVGMLTWPGYAHSMNAVKNGEQSIGLVVVFNRIPVVV